MLPYTEDVLSSLLGRYNAELWPLHIAVYLLGLVALYLALTRRRGSGRTVAGVLAFGWLWTGAVYHWKYLATLDFSAPVFAAVFILQGMLLVWAGVIRNAFVFPTDSRLAIMAGTATVVLALVGSPLLALATGVDLARSQTFALTPMATMLATMGFMLLARRPPAYLVAAPLLWSLFEGARGWYLDAPERLAAAAIAVLATAVLAVERWFHWRSTAS